MNAQKKTIPPTGLSLAGLAVLSVVRTHRLKMAILDGATALMAGDTTVDSGVIRFEFDKAQSLGLIVALDNQWMMTPRGEEAFRAARTRAWGVLNYVAY